jgi:hypothetical protein
MAGSYWDKFTKQRVSRRRALQAASMAGAGAGAIWLVGCGGGDDDEETPSGGETPEPTEGEEPAEGPRILNEKNPPVSGGRLVLSTAPGTRTRALQRRLVSFLSYTTSW